MDKTRIKPGDKATISYVCLDEDGTELERTEAPVQITFGNEELLPALEAQLARMSPGETRTVILKPKQAFGPVFADRFLEVPLEMLDLDDEPSIGDTVEVAEDGEETCPGTIVEINDNTVLIDCNHPMAGKTLTFNLSLISII